jgi:formylmethanofuran dehydrogenase subunit E
MSIQSPDLPKKLKVCCNCGEAVSGRKRMRDWEGRYWCEKCGEADNKKRLELITTQGTACAGCRQKFPEKKLQRFGNLLYCRRCYGKMAAVSSGGFVQDLLARHDPIKLAMMAGGALVALIVLVVVLVIVL